MQGPPHLLILVSLAVGSRAATPFTTFVQHRSVIPGTSTSTDPSLANPVLSQLSQPALTSGLVLSNAVKSFPRKVVGKVNSGQFIKMRELLADNISLVYQLEAIQGFLPLQVLEATRPRLREVTSLSKWCYCFLGYMATPTSDPTTRDQLTYAHLIIREALCHWEAGWLDYDRAFHQQVAADPLLRWNTLLATGKSACLVDILTMWFVLTMYKCKWGEKKKNRMIAVPGHNHQIRNHSPKI